MTIPAQYPNDMLTTKLLHHGAKGSIPLYWFLEQLATGSIYSFKDEFDVGIDERIWVNGGFTWEEDDLQGSIHGSSIPEEGEERPHEGISLRSRRVGWMPGKRATAMVSLRPSGPDGILEFGFVDDRIVDLPHVVLSKEDVVAPERLTNFSVAVRDADDSVYYGLITKGGLANPTGAGTNDKAISPLGSDYHTIMISLNEQTETRLWVNGSLTDIERSGPARASQLGLWLFASRNILEVEYIQGWQERTAI